MWENASRCQSQLGNAESSQSHPGLTRFDVRGIQHVVKCMLSAGNLVRHGPIEESKENQVQEAMQNMTVEETKGEEEKKGS